MALELAEARDANNLLHKSMARANKDNYELELEVEYLKSIKEDEEEWLAPNPVNEGGNTRPAGSANDGNSPLDFHREEQRNCGGWSSSNSWHPSDNSWSWNHYGKASSSNSWWSGEGRQSRDQWYNNWDNFLKSDEHIANVEAEQRHREEQATLARAARACDWRECQMAAHVSLMDQSVLPATAVEKYDLARFCKSRVEGMPRETTSTNYKLSAIEAIGHVEDEDLRVEMLAGLQRYLCDGDVPDGAAEGQANAVLTRGL